MEESTLNIDSSVPNSTQLWHLHVCGVGERNHEISQKARVDQRCSLIGFQLLWKMRSWKKE